MFDVTIVFTDCAETTYKCEKHVDFYGYGACIQTTNGERIFFPYRNFYSISERDKREDVEK
jgi:hypothetical protein